MRRSSVYICLIVIFSVLVVSASKADLAHSVIITDTKPIEEQMYKENCSYTISSDINLSGDTLLVPDGCTLVFKNGVIRNGVVRGRNTKISSKGKIFDNVTIEGKWLVPEISTDMFGDLSEDNALRNVIALSDSSIENIINICKGKYWLRATSDQIAGLSIRSNTKVIIDGDIQLRPNDMKRSYVILVQNCRNVSITGSGSIRGEKEQHLGKGGEWGMGIYIKNSSDVTIRDITVSNCWGDCITLAVNSEDIIIDGCTLFNARRQGISITGQNNVEVRNCIIRDIHGTNPEYGIDVEPDANGETTNITISNCLVENSGGGYLAYGGADNVKVEGVVFQNCQARNLIGKKPAFWLQYVNDCTIDKCIVEDVNCHCLRSDFASNITVSNCKLDCGTSGRVITCYDSEDVRIINNELRAPKIAINSLSNASISDNTVYCRYLTEKKASELTNVRISNNVFK